MVQKSVAGVALLALVFALVLAAAPAAAVAAAPGDAGVVERFETDPLSGGGRNPFDVEGDAAHFTFLEDAPRFPGDRPGTLRVIYDTTLPAGRIATPIPAVLSLDDDFEFGAILTIRSEGLEASPDGFDQIAFGLWNTATTGMARTSWPADTFDLVEFSWFPNVSQFFGGPWLSPTVFGGNVGGNAFFNFSFGSAEVRLPLDEPILARARYRAADRALDVTLSRRVEGAIFAPIPGAAVTVDLSRINPTFLLNRLGIAAWTEGFPSLRATVDYDLIYFGDLPVPFGPATDGRAADGLGTP